MSLEEERLEHHVLMVAFSAQGHINPMLRLAKRLVSKGLHVTLATTEIARQRMLTSSTTTTTTTTAAIAANSIAGINLAFFSDGLSLDYDRKTNLDHYMDTLAKFGAINLSTMIHNHTQSHGRKFSCLINNPFVPWVADVAAEHEIPCAMLWIQPCTLYSIYYRFYNNINHFPTLTNPDMSIELPGLPLLHTHDLPSFVLPSNPLATFPKLFTNLFQNMKKMKWVLANSFYEIEKDVIDSMSELYPIKPIGPLVPSSLLGEDEEDEAIMEMWKSEDSCIEWLNVQEPSSVIYVSFGSIAVLNAKQMDSIAMGVKNTNRPFLWVVKPSDSPKDGEGQLPLGFVEETRERGLIVPWSPQIKLLSHPAVACFLTHCGWNSLLETITAGVPVIAYPQWSDQPTNAKLVSDVLRIGVRLRPDKDIGLTDGEVAKCIEEVMVGPRSEEFRRNVAELKWAAREAVAEGGSTDRNIQWFVDEIMGNQGTRN